MDYWDAINMVIHAMLHSKSDSIDTPHHSCCLVYGSANLNSL